MKRDSGVFILWRAHHLPGVLVVSLVLLLTASSRLGGLLVPVGALTGSSDRSVSARILLTMAAAASILWTTEPVSWAIERSSARRMHVWQWFITATAIAIMCLTMATIATVSGSSASPLVRNTIGLTGLALCFRPIWGQLAWVAPMGWVLFSVLFGYQAGLGVSYWAWPISDSGGGPWCWALACIAIGAIALTRNWTRTGSSSD